MNTFVKFPFYAKASLLLIGSYVLVSVLFIGQDIILPVIYATIIAVLISPVVNFLVRKKINRFIAISGVLLIALLISAAVIILLSSQATRFRQALPQLTDKFQDFLSETAIWASGYFNISPEHINGWIANAKYEIINNSRAAIGLTLTTMGEVLAAGLLTPVYICMILFYQPHLVEFVHKLFGSSNNSRVTEILTETKTIIQSYLVGLFSEFVIIAIINSIGLLILGIDYAIMLGIIGALLNVIPYIGGIVAVGLFMAIALVTKTPAYVFYVLVLYGIIQFIDNNYIVPKVIGSKVRINALISFLAVIAGAALWGISGMFLSIPIVAIIKLILDRIEPLKPWGFLLGDTMPPLLKIRPLFKKTEKKLMAKEEAV